jgi:hypothetical protein
VTGAISLEEWLVGRGLTQQEADLWAEFIADTLDLIDDGHALLRESSEWRSFLGGCAKSVPTEPEITSGLGDRMRRLRNKAPIDSSRDRIQVSYESPTPGDELHGIRKSKADFRFEKKFEAGFAAEFVVEAKPLRVASDIARRYMAADGLGCFLDRFPPYSREFAVGMLGYAFTQPSTWDLTLAASLSSGSTSATRSGHIQMARGRSALVSDHPRTTLRLDPVTVLHSILDFA